MLSVQRELVSGKAEPAHTRVETLSSDGRHALAILLLDQKERRIGAKMPGVLKVAKGLEENRE